MILIIILLISIGIILLFLSIILPHEILNIKLRNYLEILFPKNVNTKFRFGKKIETDEYYWTCKGNLKKIPCIVNESNDLYLEIIPWYGPKKKSNIKIKQNNINHSLQLEIKPLTFDFEIMQAGPEPELSLTKISESTFILFPKNNGKKEIRLDFYFNNVFCGYWETELVVKTRQFWFVLSKNTVLTIRLLGSTLTLLGVVLGIIKYF